MTNMTQSQEEKYNLLNEMNYYFHSWESNRVVVKRNISSIPDHPQYEYLTIFPDGNEQCGIVGTDVVPV